MIVPSPNTNTNPQKPAPKKSPAKWAGLRYERGSSKNSEGPFHGKRALYGLQQNRTDIRQQIAQTLGEASRCSAVDHTVIVGE
ncbi:hypothetical protein SAMN05216605_103161 [Pseudomonas abietaniphila]|uniref:Uncharacterized protein n=1 Tax=Pseudomonas abietaniphila TaxID=89065 RepID=A0A1G7X450_9PSED|nr:hypothetical protein SAMN05216605_103161 [Pseudomonas abietaniphila]